MTDYEEIAPFAYPGEPHARRHGPRGYADAKSFKPWLRDEFEFRCVYCLVRERWCPEGEAAFSVEHLQPRGKFPELIGSYENLAYACCRCNGAKSDDEDLIDPTRVPLRDHLLIRSDGVIESLSNDGEVLILACQLSRPVLVEFRRDLFHVLNGLASLPEQTRMIVLRRFFGYPSNLPRLDSLRPPKGNQRKGGIGKSYFVRRQNEDLPEFY